jgi:hypothetical protein
LRIHNSTIYETFYETAGPLGFIANKDQEADICLQDAIALRRPPSDIRFLLAQMVHYGASREPLEFEFRAELADGDEPRDSVHRKIDFLLDPDRYVWTNHQEEDQVPVLFAPDSPLSLLTTEQRIIAFDILNGVLQNTNELMFLQGSAGTGKTFTVKVLISALESCAKKCLICGTTGIAASQYPGGTTLHSLFRLGIDEEFRGSFRSNIGRETPQA